MGFLYCCGQISLFSVLVSYVMSCGSDIAGLRCHDKPRGNDKPSNDLIGWSRSYLCPLRQLSTHGHVRFSNFTSP